MNPTGALTTTKPSALDALASRFSVDRTKLLATLKNTVFHGANDDELMALAIVAGQYGLNPFTREIYAFQKKGGGIVPVVGIDGWARVMNDRPEFDGIEFEFSGEGDELGCTATIHVKNRSKPVKVTEYLTECYRETDPWKKCPRRMLRHKATIQAARLAFGLSGISDPDEAEEIKEATVTAVETAVPPIETAKLPTDPPVVVEAQPPTKSLSDQLGELCVRRGVSFDKWLAWAREKFAEEVENADGFETVPDTVAKGCLRASEKMFAQIEGGAK